jgi:glycosyltransferase involved in cell wall biosynthesis
MIQFKFAAKHEAAGRAEIANEELVTVIVAAYNAEKTIGETLHSVRAQTYRTLEILVVDDGSVDRTSEIVEEHIKADSRVRLIYQSNGGVAAARNRAITEARGEYIAPIDADDLWCPTKIDKQIKAMRNHGPKVALVYTWSALIDFEGTISSRPEPEDEGDVLARMCLGNLPGNASSALMRKQVLLDVGGYDVSLRLKRAQGCEDWKLYLNIAESYEFAVVRQHLTYYRVTDGNMSSDVLQMLRSHDLVASEFRKAYPEYAEQFRESRDSILKWLIRRALLNANLWATAVLTMRLFRNDYRCAVRFLREALVRLPSFFLKCMSGAVNQSCLNRESNDHVPGTTKSDGCDIVSATQGRVGTRTSL